jgi:hypothetical protein
MKNGAAATRERTQDWKKTVPGEDEILQSRILQLSTGMIFGAWEKISWDSFSNAIYWLFDIVLSKFFVTF